MKKKNTSMSDADEVVKLTEYSADQKNSDARGGNAGDHDEPEDDDRRGPGGGQRVQCQQQ